MAASKVWTTLPRSRGPTVERTLATMTTAETTTIVPMTPMLSTTKPRVRLSDPQRRLLRVARELDELPANTPESRLRKPLGDPALEPLGRRQNASGIELLESRHGQTSLVERRELKEETPNGSSSGRTTERIVRYSESRTSWARNQSRTLRAPGQSARRVQSRNAEGVGPRLDLARSPWHEQMQARLYSPEIPARSARHPFTTESVPAKRHAGSVKNQRPDSRLTNSGSMPVSL